MYRLQIPALMLVLSAAPLLAADLPAPERPPIASFGCTGCHGASGEGYESIPRISGKPEVDFMQKMQAFRAATGSTGVMGRIARGVDDREYAELARYFGRAEKTR